MKKIRRNEILIIVFILAALLLPQVIGTTTARTQLGSWRHLEDLNGRVIGVAKDAGLEATAWLQWPDSEIFSAEDEAQLPQLVADEKIDAFLTDVENVASIMEQYPELTALTEQIRVSDPEGKNVETDPDGKNGETDPGSKNGDTDPDSKNGDTDPDTEDGAAGGAHTVAVILAASNYAYLTPKTTLEDLDRPGVRIAALTGSELAAFPAEFYPESEILNYNNFTDMFMALESGRADAAVAYNTQLEMVDENYRDLACIPVPLANVAYGFGTARNEKGAQLKDAFNDYLADLKKSGEFQRITRKWAIMTEGGDDKLPDSFSGENGILHVCTTGGWFPMTYYSGSVLTGNFYRACERVLRERGIYASI